MTADREPCPRTDAVLALCLDGHVGQPDDGPRRAGPADPATLAACGYGFVSEDSVQVHLQSCVDCQQALRRSRRLDAVLAAGAGRAFADHVAAGGAPLAALERRWFGAVAAAAAATGPAAADATTGNGPADAAPHAATSIEHGPPSVRRRQLHRQQIARRRREAVRLTGVALLVTCVSALGWSVSGASWGAAAGTAPERSARAASDAPAPARPDGGFAHGLAQRLNARRSPGAPAPAVRTDAPDQASPSIAELAQRLADRNRDPRERVAAGRRLLAATQPGAPAAERALDALVAGLAGCGDRTPDLARLHDELIDGVRASESATAGLQRRLAALAAPGPNGSAAPGDGAEATLVVAARVGGAPLDLAIRRALRRHPELTNVLAGALRTACGRPVAGLLLDAWQDQVAIGGQSDDETWARHWFAGQVRATFDEVRAELTAARSSARRVRCLLALGCAPDGAAVDALQAHLESPQRQEALAAAVGLAELPHRVLEPLLDRARGQDDGLLRAALARAGLPAAVAWLQRFDVSATERDGLRHGSLPRFGEAVGALRNRGVITD